MAFFLPELLAARMERPPTAPRSIRSAIHMMCVSPSSTRKVSPISTSVPVMVVLTAPGRGQTQTVGG